jgi:CheY-like chemotaxis protein
MAECHKLLLLDDDEQMLELYREILQQLPSQPEVTVSDSGARAIALLESEPFSLLITDLRMPKMDGLQVLTIVRRKYPQLRIIVLTGVVDEEYRSRAYALGVDLFWQKPGSEEEFTLFKDCIESLLGREAAGDGGFRGMQSKSLVDLIQLECLSQSSSVLRISQGTSVGKIWIKEGEIIDSIAGDFTGEEAFREILSWKTGNFEILPNESDHVRTITNSTQGLLLDSAQAMDEWRGQQAGAPPGANTTVPTNSALAALARFEGVEFVLTMPVNEKLASLSWGLDNVDQTAAWSRETQKKLRDLGEKLGAGTLSQVSGFGLQRHWALAGDYQRGGLLCVGFRRTLAKDKVDQSMKQVFNKWTS